MSLRTWLFIILSKYFVPYFGAYFVNLSDSYFRMTSQYFATIEYICHFPLDDIVYIEIQLSVVCNKFVFIYRFCCGLSIQKKKNFEKDVFTIIFYYINILYSTIQVINLYICIKFVYKDRLYIEVWMWQYIRVNGKYRMK